MGYKIRVRRRLCDSRLFAEFAQGKRYMAIICLYCKPEFKYKVIKNISEFEEAVACEFIGQIEIFFVGNLL